VGPVLTGAQGLNDLSFLLENIVVPWSRAGIFVVGAMEIPPYPASTKKLVSPSFHLPEVIYSFFFYML
jgi:hypothetical protein